MSTWTQITASGSGPVGYRLAIEGWPHEWTTHALLTHSDGAETRRVLPGLQFEGLQISERTVLRDGWPEVANISVRIFPSTEDEDTVNGFTRTPEPVAYLLDRVGIPGILPSATAWALDVGGNLPAGYYHIGTECIFQNAGGALSRGRWSTQAQAHFNVYANSDATTAGSYAANPTPVYDWPPTMEGRRAYLYAYGESDNPAGDGTLIWRGVVLAPPKMDSTGAGWTIELASVVKLLEQNVASASAMSYRIRGVYHSRSSPLFVWGQVTIGIPIGELSVPLQTGFRACGFFESDTEWVNHVTGVINSATWTAQLGLGRPSFGISNGRYTLNLVVGSADRKRMTLICRDVIDGDMIRSSARQWSGTTAFTQSNNEQAYQGYEYTVMSGDSSGEFVIEDSSLRPHYGYPLPQCRGLLGSPSFDKLGAALRGTADDGLPYSSSDTTWPDDRIYLDSITGLSIGNLLVVANGDEITVIRVTGVYVTDPLAGGRSGNFITASMVSPKPGGLWLSEQSVITPLRVYATDGNFSSFIASVVAASPYANLGDTPYITLSDVQAELWPIYFLGANGTPLMWLHRNYHFLKSLSVRSVLQPEFQGIGLMGRLEADGRFGFTKLPLVSSTRAALHSLTDDEILYGAAGLVGFFPRWEAQPDGLVNSVKLRLGYLAFEDDYDEALDFNIRAISSIAEHKTSGKGNVDIEVKSTTVPWGAEVSANDIATTVADYLRVLSMDYAVVTFAVPFTKFGVLCGDLIQVTCATVPDGLGGRGITNKKGVVVGRKWNLDPGQPRMGELTVYFPRSSSSGYTPTGRITGQSSLGGNNWRLTFSAINTRNVAWSEAGDGIITTHFAPSDQVRIVPTDTTSSAGTVQCMVISVGAQTIDISVNSGNWTPGSTTWNLMFGWSQTYVPRQHLYTFVSDTARQLVTGLRGRVFV